MYHSVFYTCHFILLNTHESLYRIMGSGLGIGTGTALYWLSTPVGLCGWAKRSELQQSSASADDETGRIIFLLYDKKCDS